MVGHHGNCACEDCVGKQPPKECSKCKNVDWVKSEIHLKPIIIKQPPKECKCGHNHMSYVGVGDSDELMFMNECEKCDCEKYKQPPKERSERGAKIDYLVGKELEPQPPKAKSSCCNAHFIHETDVCSKCKEHSGFTLDLNEQPKTLSDKMFELDVTYHCIDVATKPDIKQTLKADLEYMELKFNQRIKIAERHKENLLRDVLSNLLYMLKRKKKQLIGEELLR